MKHVYVDESGDLGTGERYFVIALLDAQNRRVGNIIKRYCAENVLDEVKASRLTFPQKQEIFNKFRLANDYTLSYIVLDKHNLDNKKLLDDKNLCYNYLFSFLVKRTIKSAKSDLTILLDNHSTKVKSINSLADYIKLKAYTDWGYRDNLHIRYTDSRDCKPIQATDVMANAVYAKYRYGVTHFYNMMTIGESIKFPESKFGSGTVVSGKPGKAPASVPTPAEPSP